MPEDEDVALSEKRLYGARREGTVVWVGSDMGLTRVEASGGQIGRFSLVRPGSVRDLAAGGEVLLVATAEDVLVGTVSGFEGADFGPAVAVGIADDGTPLAAAPGGTIARRREGAWHEVARCEGAVRAIDDPLIAATDGVYHRGEGLEHAGLDDGRDVAAAGPYAATAAGCYHRRDGWTSLLDGDVTVVAAADGRLHAVRDELLEYRDGAWEPCDVDAAAPIVDLDYGECPYAISAEGQLFVHPSAEATPDGAAGWRDRHLGIDGVTALVVA